MSVTPICDLRPAFGAARDQGCRPTCTAFACSDLHAACRSPWIPLSCEYAFYHAVARQNTDPNCGVHLCHMLDVVHQDGQPPNTAWPYLPHLPDDLDHWAPPPDVGLLFYAKGDRATGGSLIIREKLEQGHPVLLVMSISDAFIQPDKGGVVDADEPVDTTRMHALIAVGHGADPEHEYTLVRNSWGTGWGVGGYAWISERYLTPRLSEFATMTEVN